MNLCPLDEIHLFHPSRALNIASNDTISCSFTFQKFYRLYTRSMDQLSSCGWVLHSFWCQWRIRHLSKKCLWRLRINCLWQGGHFIWPLGHRTSLFPPLPRYELRFSFHLHLFFFSPLICSSSSYFRSLIGCCVSGFVGLLNCIIRVF